MKVTLKYVPNQDYNPESPENPDWPGSACASFDEIQEELARKASCTDRVDLEGNRVPIEVDAVASVAVERPKLLDAETKLGRALVKEIEQFDSDEEIVSPQITFIVGDEGHNPTTVIDSPEKLDELCKKSTSE
jgi:hypothetical protein